MMKKLTLALVQSKLHWEDRDANLKMFSDKLSEVKQKADVIILPEMFTTGFSMNSEELAEVQESVTLEWMRTEAKKQDAVLTGSFICKVDDKHFFNRLIWMQPDGEYFHYDKRHLFRMADEQDSYSPGEKRLIVEYKGWKICPLICYDLRFPAFSRNINIEKGKRGPVYDLLIYVACWPAPRNNAWKSLIQARAIENQSYVAGVNRVGKDGMDVDYSGSSSVISAKGIKLSEAEENKEEIIYAELNKDALEAFRERFPVHLDADKYEIG